MKKITFILVLTLLFGGTFVAQAQLGKLKDKADKAVNKVQKDKDKSTNSTNNPSTTSNADASKPSTQNSVADKGSSMSVPTVNKPTVEFATDYTFKNKKTSFEPGEDIFIRLITPKPMGEMFKEAFKMQDVPMSGAMAIAIAKDADDENPIVVTQYPFFPNRYKDDKQFAITLQIDESKLEKLPSEAEGKVSFNSIQTLAKGDVKLIWSQEVAKFTPKNYSWTIFFFYRKANSEDIAEAGSGVFTYNVTNENKQKLIGGMNFYDKERFEKLPDDGITNDLHKNNINKIVFANNKIDANFSDASKIKTNFANLSAGIYGRVYLKESVRNMLANDGRGKDFGGAGLTMVYRVNGKTYVVDDEISKEDGLKKTSWGLTFIPNNPADNKDKITATFVYVTSILPAGKHKIKVQYRLPAGAVSLDQTALLGENEIEVNIAIPDRDAVAKKYGRTFQGNSIPETDFVAAVKKQYVGLAHRFSRMEIYRDAFGQVAYRLSRVTVAYKNPEGEYLTATYDLKQDFVGGKWAPSIGIHRSLGTEYVPPQNIKP
ncbi:MAG: hypothetical protein OHK0045_03970 [Raineya sp.]